MGIHLMSQTCLPGEWKGETLFGFRLNSWGGAAGGGQDWGPVERGGQRDWVRGSLWPRTHLCCPLEPMVATADPLDSQLGKTGLRAGS